MFTGTPYFRRIRQITFLYDVKYCYASILFLENKLLNLMTKEELGEDLTS